jgi:outer membrane protein TolC
MQHVFRYISLVVIVLFTITNATAQRDSIYTLTLDEFIQRVEKNHPIAKQAQLQIERGESNMRLAKGALDPKLEAGIDQKYYDETTYYSTTTGGIKIPTRSPISFKAGYELNDGKYLNPIYTVPQDGLYNAGVSLPLLQGLMTDERRTAIRQAEAFQDFTEAERQKILNSLLYEAYGAYWNWWSSVEKTNITVELIDLASTRFEAIKQRAIAGDRPFIDTVEAYLQVQLRQQQYIDALITETKARYFLSSFLWTDASDDKESVGLIIAENTTPTEPLGLWPDSVIALDSKQLYEIIDQNHPELRAYDAKIAQLVFEERWKREKLKPKLDLEYNALAENFNTAGDQGFSTNNYKWGMTFSFPIFLREARGDLQITRIKISESTYERELKTTELANKAQAAFLNFSQLQNQFNIVNQNVNNYRLLLDAERTRFFNGESSLFLVNQREVSLADAQMKRIDIQSKLEMTIAEARYQIGKISNK